ncbi:MAG: hypothetical protein FJX53_02450 [Alphaproteobacteria bacterium]|nr:hypothetical protein [Alphaproteobacteria bacterium]
MTADARLRRLAMQMQAPLGAPWPTERPVVAFSPGGLMPVESALGPQRVVVALEVPAGGAAAFLESAWVLGALDAGANVVATCASEADASELRRLVSGSAGRA